MTQPDQDLLMKLLEQAVCDSLITYPECYGNLESESEECKYGSSC